MVYGEKDERGIKCRTPSMFEIPGVREAAIWQPILATSYRPSGEILSTDNFFQDYKYFYGNPECDEIRIIDERREKYFFHEDGNLDLNGERFNYTQYCVATIGLICIVLYVKKYLNISNYLIRLQFHN